jgi:4-hydroxy-4-methyl-2-oxoglutarate aldolase
MMAHETSMTYSRDISAEDIARARALAAASLYEANQKRGALDPAIRQMAPGLTVCGPAMTVRCQPGDNLTLHAAVAEAQPGVVIVADVGDFADAGHWGEVLTVAATSRHIAGLVINGGVRDVAALVVHEFPVFARAVCMKATTKVLRGLIDVPIVCGGVTIHPGDLIVGDADGVVAIRHDEVSDVLRLAQEREDAESVLMDQLRDGAVTLDLLNLRALADGGTP